MVAELAAIFGFLSLYRAPICAGAGLLALAAIAAGAAVKVGRLLRTENARRKRKEPLLKDLRR